MRYWLFLLLLALLGKTHAAGVFDLVENDEICSLPGGILTARQESYCTRYPKAVEVVARAAGEAKEHCERLFGKERWNCARKLTGEGTAESALLAALGSAVASSKVARECSSGRLEHCGCGRSAVPGESKGCSDNFKFGNSFTTKFFESRASSALKRVEAHNAEAGLRILLSNRIKRCRCHGISASCAAKTCSWVVPSMSDLSELLKAKYDSAQKVIESSDGTLIDFETRQPVAKTQLAFLNPSIEFCTHTRGRMCGDDEHCEALCCGRGFTTERRMETVQCNCKFVYCCEVQCESCLKVVEQRYCL